MRKLIYIGLCIFVLLSYGVLGADCFDDGYNRKRNITNHTTYDIGALLNESINGSRIWVNPSQCSGNMAVCWESSNESNISIYCNDTILMPFERNDNATSSYNITDVWNSEAHFINHLENSSFNDSSNNHMYIINNGATYNASGKIGGAYNFSGDAGSYMYTDKKLFKTEHNFSVNLWLYPNNVNSGTHQYILNTVDTGTPFPETFLVRIDNDDNHIYFYKRTGTTTDVDYVRADISGRDKTWFMVTIVFNDTVGSFDGHYAAFGMQIFIDGVKIDNSALDSNFGGYGNHKNELYIGANGPAKTDQNFIGLIDDIRIWNKTLIPQEIEELFNMTNLNNKYNLLGAEQSPSVSGNINLTLNIPVDNANITDSNNISVNYTITGNLTPIDKQWYSVDGNVTNVTITGNFSVVLSNGLYNLTVCANATDGNESCDTHAINVSVLITTLLNPTNVTYITSNILNIQYIYTGGVSIDKQWYSIDGYTTNTTITGNFTETFLNGTHTLYLCVNSTGGSESCDSATFTMAVPQKWVIIDDMSNPPNPIFKINRATGDVYIYGNITLYGNITYI